MITVGQLVKQLQEVNQDRIVVLSKDSEGNEYNPLDYIESCYITESRHKNCTGPAITLYPY